MFDSFKCCLKVLIHDFKSSQIHPKRIGLFELLCKCPPLRIALFTIFISGALPVLRGSSQIMVFVLVLVLVFVLVFVLKVKVLVLRDSA